MRNVIMILLLVISLSTAYLFWYHPPVKITALSKFPPMADMPKPEYDIHDKGMPLEMPRDMIKKDVPAPVPTPAPVVPKPNKLKQGLKDWLDIGSKAIPVISFLGAIFTRRKKK